MSRDLGWKDQGDRVICVSKAKFGQPGTVLRNDGWGHINVELDSGGFVSGWETRDFIYEDESLPDKPIDDDNFMPAQTGFNRSPLP